MSKVFITNRAGHDYSGAKKFGDLIFMTEGNQPRFHVSRMYSTFCEFLKDSSPDDLILMTGFAHMNSVATAIFAFLHGRLNLLLYTGRDKYIVRKVILGELLTKENSDESN